MIISGWYNHQTNKGVLTEWFYTKLLQHIGMNNYKALPLISNFRRVLYVVCYLLGNALASGFYIPTLQNTLFRPHRQVGVHMKMEQTECSETSTYKIQTPENYPEDNIQHPLRCSPMVLTPSCGFAGALAKHYKRLLPLSCPSVFRMYQRGSHWTDFREIWFWVLLSKKKSVEKSQISLKRANNNGFFTRRPISFIVTGDIKSPLTL